MKRVLDIAKTDLWAVRAFQSIPERDLQLLEKGILAQTSRINTTLVKNNINIFL
jgi:hypothetical protein